MRIRRADLGIPADWSRVRAWLNYRGPIPTKCSTIAPSAIKCPEIPVLEKYDGTANQDFWDKFPKKDLPLVPETQINVERLSEELALVSDKLTQAQRDRGMRALDFLSNGAPSNQVKRLGSSFTKNSPGTLKHGAAVSDNIATWVKQGFAAGPFEAPPLPDFRVNPLLAVVQPGKIRPVLNVSMPVNNSYNSNIDQLDLEKVKMTSAREFGSALMACGHNAVMSKYDLVSAYKQVPCKIEDLRLQGFMWNGKFFTETRLIFGASNSVCNFDTIGETIKAIAVANSEIPNFLVMRQIDDVPIVAPANTTWCQDFSLRYKSLCKSCEIELAPNCKMNEKAFENQVRGKVLGILFDSTDLSWSIPEDKCEKTLKSIREVFDSSEVSLIRMQKLMGRLNHLTQMCSFMQLFMSPLNESFKNIPSDADPNTVLTVSPQGKKDLLVWAGFLLSELKWLPIPRPPTGPPLYRRELYTDAAGLPEMSQLHKGPGCGGVALYETGEIAFAFQHVWSKDFLLAVDTKGIKYGDKSTTLEAIGLLMPMILNPSFFRNQHVVVRIDNLGVVWGVLNKKAKEDSTATVIIRCILLLSAYLECKLHVEHQPRVSDWGSRLADRLSRLSSTSDSDHRLLANWNLSPLIPGCLSSWFRSPGPDYSLASDLLDHLSSMD